MSVLFSKLLGAGASTSFVEEMASSEVIPPRLELLPSRMTPEGIEVDHYPYEDVDPIEVCINGTPIWYVNPAQSKFSTLDRGFLIIRWPPKLADTFRGLIKVQLKHGGEIFAENQFTVGNATDIFELKDNQGKALMVNKWGKLARPLSPDSIDFDKVLKTSEELIALIKEKAGLDLFAIGGTLLGAMRDGQIVSGDDDADWAYLSEHENITDIVLESFELERMLRAEGYELFRYSGAHIQLYFPPRDYDYEYYIDIGAYFSTGGNFYGTAQAFAPEEKVQILPLTSANLIGYDIPVPADGAAVMEATYGPRWEKPDPSFEFTTNTRIKRRYYWWLHDMCDDFLAWQAFHRDDIYKSLEAPKDDLVSLATIKDTPEISTNTDFAEFVCQQIDREFDQPVTVLDLGSGLSNDPQVFVNHGHEVLAVDFSNPAQLWRQQNPIDGVTAVTTNLINLREVVQLAERLAEVEGPLVIYGKQWWDTFRWNSYISMMPLIRQLISRGAPAYFESIFSPLEKGEERQAGFDWYSHIPQETHAARFGHYGMEMLPLKENKNKSWYKLVPNAPFL